MAWYRAGGGGIPASLKTGMNDVLNKKFGTSTTYAPNTWPDNVNLLGKLPEKTVSGAIAHIDDGADRVPIKSWEVTIAPTLTGVSSVSETQTGRNVRQNVTDYLSVNHVFFQYRNYYAGQATGYPILEGTFKAGTYTLSFNTTESIEASRVRVWAKKKSDQNWYNLSANGDLVTPTSSGYSFCSESLGHVTGTFTINEECAALGFGYYQYGTSIPYTDLMLEVGSTASDYTPYTAPTVSTAQLGRTVYGGSVDVVQGTGTETYGLQTFDGTETWTLYETSFWYTSKPQTNVKNVHPCVTSNGVKITYTTTGQIRCYISENPGVVDTSTDMNALLSNGVSFNYQLNENVDFTFTPITPTPETKLGVNNFWADEGDSQVTYRRDIDLALGGG